MRRISQVFAVTGLLAGLFYTEASSQATVGDTCSTFKRVWVGEIDQDLDNFRYRYPTPSPDGRYVTEVTWSTGDLSLRDLATGELRRVTNKGKPWSESQDWAWSPVFSPDGSQVAYMWFVSRTGYEVRIINVDESGARTVYDKHCWPHCRLEDWSDDGEQLLATVGSQETSQLLVISVEDGSHRVLKTFDHRAPQLASFSPDGRRVAYDRPSDRDTGDWDVYVISLDGDEDVVLVGGPEDDRLMGWMPDGGVLLYSNRASTRGIWRLPVEDGRAAGNPTLIRGDLWKVWPLGFSQDAYFYGVVLEEPQVQIAAFDLEGLAVLGAREPVSDPTGGSTSEAVWSHDGRYLAYKLHRDPYMAYKSLGGGAGDRLVIRSLSGEEVREIDVALDEWGRINWTPDGSAVVIAGRDAKRNLGIFRLDIAPERLVTLHLLEQGSYEALEGYALSPDGTTLYFGRQSDQTSALVALDITTDRERLVTHLPRADYNLRLSPDGQWIALGGWSSTQADSVALAVVPTAGGELRDLYRALPGEIRPEFIWSPDSRELIFAYWNSVEDDAALWTISPLGGPPETVRELGCYYCVGKERSEQGPESIWFIAGKIQPDGRHVVGVGGSSRGEIWMIENLVGKACR